MVKHVQSKDLNHTWNINTNGDTWILAESAKITVSTEPAVYVGGSFTGNTIRINGDIEADSDYGVQVSAESTAVEIGANAKVSNTVNSAVFFEFGGNTLHNSGVVTSGLTAVLAFAETSVTNDGTIRGNIAVGAQDGLQLTNSGKLLGKEGAVGMDADGSTLVNLESGVIKSQQIGINIADTGNYKIVNNGLISGVSAIIDDNGNGRIVNRGTIEGNVYLGTNADSFDARKGVVHGKVFGGDGDDIFTVDDQSLKIVERSDEGRDTVRSTADYVLGNFLDNLQLLGAGNSKATGNAIENMLFGNSGKNVLKGLGGDDYLDGGRGNDQLFGGGAKDSFVFNAQTGDDVVVDFFDGVDVITSTYVENQADVDALLADHVKVSGKDLLITFGDDSLLIKNLAKDDLTAADFNF
jgi:Ca2+-binding RTX toxin-like protein